MSESNAHDRLPPLAAAALALIGDGATAQELLDRFAAETEELTVSDSAATLDHLATLGLVRIASRHHQPRYSLTTLGMQVLNASLTGDTLALAELERLRSDLFSTVSHELRTPLTAVRTCVGLLLDPSTHPNQSETQQLLETIGRNADRMQQLVADVLDLARYRTGNVQLQLRRFDADELARSVAAAVQPLAMAHGQTISMSASSSPSWVFGDHRRLEQALLNLVSNAQKYSPDGTTIDVRVEAGNEFVHWVVGDQGPGISLEDQAHLFERFFVGGSDAAEPRSGVGLGLPTALAIAQAHGGRIDVESELGRGSRFTLCVPAGGPDEDET